MFGIRKHSGNMACFHQHTNMGNLPNHSEKKTQLAWLAVGYTHWAGRDAFGGWCSKLDNAMSNKLTKNFTRTEFTCRCGCGLCNPDPVFMAMLQKAREISGIPYTIISGCRCTKHNQKVEGKPKSDHLPDKVTGLCRGADIRAASDRQRFLIIKGLIEAGFKRIGINLDKGFIHAGHNPDNPQNVLFRY